MGKTTWHSVVMAHKAAHVDYGHIYPLKHRLARRVADWPYSTYYRYMEAGIYPLD